jgi:dienelactone hydrolase
MSLLPVLFALACATDPGQVPDDTAAPYNEAPTANPYGDAEGCLVLTEGRNTVVSAGLERQVTLVLPEDPQGAPIVFAWHWLGGSADQILSWMEMESLADRGAIVVAADSTGMQTEWDYLADPDASVDAALYDDLLVCLWDAYGFDPERVHATGMSAGGLFTSYLTMHRAETLASTVPFSGGVTRAYYSAPTVDVPVMLVWGGATDRYGGYDFHAAALSFSSNLRDDGSFVVECEHDLGHRPPQGAADMAWTFFEDHPADVQGQPWATGLPGSLPDYCRLP